MNCRHHISMSTANSDVHGTDSAYVDSKLPAPAGIYRYEPNTKMSYTSEKPEPFSEHTRLEVKARSNDQCLACYSSPVNAVPVIPKHDPSVRGNTSDEDGADKHAGQHHQWMLGSEYMTADTIERYSPVIETSPDVQEGSSKCPKDWVKACPSPNLLQNTYKEKPC